MKSHRKTAPLVARLAGLSCVAAALFGLGGSAHAQPADGVRVIDLKYIFDHHDRFRAAMASLKTEFEASAKRVQDERNAIVQLEGRLKELVVGSPDYKRLDEEIARRKSEWKLQSDKQLKAIREREADILKNVYYEVTSALNEYCQQQNIGLVMQFNGDPPDDKTQRGLMAMMGRNVLYVTRDRDITPHILRMVNTKTADNNNRPVPRPSPVSVPVPR